MDKLTRYVDSILYNTEFIIKQITRIIQIKFFKTLGYWRL